MWSAIWLRKAPSRLVPFNKRSMKSCSFNKQRTFKSTNPTNRSLIYPIGVPAVSHLLSHRCCHAKKLLQCCASLPPCSWPFPRSHRLKARSHPHFDGVLAAAILSLTVMLLFSMEIAAHRGKVKNINWPHTYCSIFNVILALWTYYRGEHAVTMWILGASLLVGTLCQSVCSGSLIANRTSICNVILSALRFATLFHSDSFHRSPIAWVVAVLNFLFVLPRTTVALMYFSSLFSSMHFLVPIACVYMSGWGWLLYAIFTCPMVWLDDAGWARAAAGVLIKLVAGAAISGLLEQCYQPLAVLLQHAHLTRAYGNRIGQEM